jgi:hypothetical protein
MGVVRLKAETTFLRAFAKTYFAEVAFSAKAELTMRKDRINLAEIQQVLRTGVVTYTEKEESCGAQWTVEGLTCDDDRLRIWLDVYCNEYHVCVVDLIKIARASDD